MFLLRISYCDRYRGTTRQWRESKLVNLVCHLFYICFTKCFIIYNKWKLLLLLKGFLNCRSLLNTTRTLSNRGVKLCHGDWWNKSRSRPFPLISNYTIDQTSWPNFTKEVTWLHKYQLCIFKAFKLKFCCGNLYTNWQRATKSYVLYEFPTPESSSSIP